MDSVAIVLSECEREPNVRCSRCVRAEAVLQHLTRRGTKLARTAQDDPVGLHAGLAKTGFETFSPNSRLVAAEDEHLGGVEPNFLGAAQLIREITCENTPADPVTEASGATWIIVRGARGQNARRKDLSINDKWGSSIRPGRLTGRIAGRGNDRKGPHIDCNIHRERLIIRVIRVLTGRRSQGCSRPGEIQLPPALTMVGKSTTACLTS